MPAPRGPKVHGWNTPVTTNSRQHATSCLRCAVGIVFMLAAGAARPAPGDPAPTAAALVDPAIARRHLAGAVVLVTDPESPLLVEAFGLADIEAGRPMAADSLFWIASMSKPMTAAAVMILVDEGTLSLDDPVAKHLPEFLDLWAVAEKSSERIVLERPARPITIRDCLAHTSGLPFKSVVEEPSLDLQPLAFRTRSYTQMHLLFQPGTGWQYSNAGINTAGRVIEVVSGMPYEHFMERRLFRALGMKDTTFRPTASQLGRLATAYRANKAATDLESTPISQLRYPLDAADRQPTPAGGLFSTADDCGRFCRMMLGRGRVGDLRILSEAAVAELTRSHAPPSAPRAYGLGFQIGQNGSFGHDGAYATSMTIDPARQIAVVWLVQNAGSPPEWRACEKQFREWAFERFSRRP